MNKIKRTVGDFVKIKLADNSYSYGRVLEGSLMAFYNIKSVEDMPLDTIDKSDILFKVWVMDRPIETCRWPVVGNLPLTDELLKPVAFVNQDPITKRIYKLQDSVEMDVTREEALQLERAAVWSDRHIEDRLFDHFNGVENKWVHSLQVKFD